MALQDIIDRVQQEKEELDLKLSKLNTFVKNNQSFQSLSPKHQNLLIEQAEHMTNYSFALGALLRLFEQEKKNLP